MQHQISLPQRTISCLKLEGTAKTEHGARARLPYTGARIFGSRSGVCGLRTL